MADALLLKTLKKFGTHRHNCDCVDGDEVIIGCEWPDGSNDEDCTCGFFDAIRAANAEKTTGEPNDATKIQWLTLELQRQRDLVEYLQDKLLAAAPQVSPVQAIDEREGKA